jgi:hypothetical protein
MLRDDNMAYLALLTSDVPQSETPLNTRPSVISSRCLQEMEPHINEVLGVFACRSEIDQLNLDSVI